jgi:hypothetical protein
MTDERRALSEAIREARGAGLRPLALALVRHKDRILEEAQAARVESETRIHPKATFFYPVD